MVIRPCAIRPYNAGQSRGGCWMPVFFVCAGLLGLLAVSLTVSVGRMRMQKKIYLGDGGDPEMLAAIRAHGNFMEYVPLCLALIYFASDYYGYWPVAIASLILLI